MENRKLLVSATPHIRAGETTRDIMLDVVIALSPAAVMGAYYFGLRAGIIMALSVASAVVFELLFNIIAKRPRTIGDMSAVVTGLLLAFNLPVTVPLWLPVAGAAFAIIIVKMLFGGLGQNFMNPALGARAFLLAAYPAAMTNWDFNGTTARFLDAYTGATPLAILKNGGSLTSQNLLDAFTGNIAGCIGETCTIALLLGFAYLLIRRVISWRIPVTYLATFSLFAWIMGRSGALTGNALYELCLGGVMLGAIFMATDYSTSPITAKGQIIMGVGCGALTAVIRMNGGYPEGVTYAILLMNLTVPLIDKFTKPKVYGEVRQGGKPNGSR